MHVIAPWDLECDFGGVKPGIAEVALGEGFEAGGIVGHEVVARGFFGELGFDLGMAGEIEAEGVGDDRGRVENMNFWP